jgi:hypothetical protein
MMFLVYAAMALILSSGIVSLALIGPERCGQWLIRLAAYPGSPMPQRDPDASYLIDLVDRLAFGALGMAGVFLAAAGLGGLLAAAPVAAQLPLGLPWLHWHLRLDALSGFFLMLIGVATLVVSLYGPGYVRHFRQAGYSLTVLGSCTALFVAGMALVVVSDDAFMFMVAWELMSVASYFLVAFQHEHAPNRRASFLYLLMAVVGAIHLILAFGIVAGAAHGFTFDALRQVELSPVWASIAFALALIGFGMKAGLIPLHAWLPEAHPVAPSHISALMSGVMLKVAVYGFIRFVFDLVGDLQASWGVVTVAVGTVSAALGALYAFQQNNLKRLLAYSSIENIGIIFMGLGLSLIFAAQGHEELGVIGLVAALYHAANHAAFKTLLFLQAGTVLHQTHEGDLEQLGGLIHRLPHTSLVMLIGCIAIAGLPPLNGFVSEWLTFQAALQAAALDSGILRSVIPVAAALLALTGAVTAATFVKAYGIGFLGRPRSRRAAHANEVGDTGMLAGPALLAGLCILLGVFPNAVIAALSRVSLELFGKALTSANANGWLWLTPVSRSVASYSAPVVFAAFLIAGWFGYRLLRSPRVVPERNVPRWDCGFGGLTARMQYTSTAFSQPLRRVFDPLYEVRETVRSEPRGQALDTAARLEFDLAVDDRSWRHGYLPIGRWVESAARKIGRIQTGNVRTYIAYSFFTLLLLLAVVS